MRNRSFISLSILLIAFTFLCVACHTEDDYQRNYYYQSTSELNSRILEGMDLVAENEAREFQRLYEAVLSMCFSDRLGVITNPYIYLEENEYKELKDFFASANSPDLYYLLIDKYMLCEHGGFPYMFVDIIEDKYPGLRDLAEMKSNYINHRNNINEVFPITYVEMITEEIEIEKQNN